MRRISLFDDPVFERPAPAICVLADALSLSHKEARDALRALVAAGYVIAPREPTNAMLEAYLEAYGTPCSTPRGAIVGIGKARKRWAAMADRGTAMAMSGKRIAQGIEARQGQDAQRLDRNDESPVAESDAPKPNNIGETNDR